MIAAIEYEVAVEPTPDELVKVVNARIAQGWRPQGGVAHEGEDGINFYYQALVREGNQRKEKQ